MKKAQRICSLIPAAITTSLCLFAIPTKSVDACGWWGDGEMNRHNDLALTAPNGQSAPQSLTLKASKLPGRIGYGIAVEEPGLAMPYLQATQGRQVNRIAELKAFGFETVIDLGTPEKTARLHRSETEALGMRYISIPVDGAVPSQEQVDDFTQQVIDASNSRLLVYSPTSALLGAMWAAYRFNLGAPLEFAIKQGKNLGMEAEQEAALRKRMAIKKGLLPYSSE
ncbi:MAG: hypothetical protein KZQ95_12220 [Candidatus Thiodiazotropha sp. (ex Epidulcina cf. delphinae)]|nr:hypothetical protein [Candidatus Thiodiazotropha sp. (ex Epidulcina cf. delphinae)]